MGLPPQVLKLFVQVTRSAMAACLISTVLEVTVDDRAEALVCNLVPI